MTAIQKVRTWMTTAAFAAVCAAVGAQGGPGAGLGPEMGMHRPPMERMLGPAGSGRWWNNPDIVEKLKLTDDQRKTMDQILLQHREKLVDLHANLEKAELGLEPLMSADQPNEGQIVAQIDKVAQARAELEKANARFLLALRAKLSADQWKQLQALHAERHDWRERRMEPGGPRHRMAPPAPGMPTPPATGAPEPPGPQSLLQPGPDTYQLQEFAPTGKPAGDK